MLAAKEFVMIMQVWETVEVLEYESGGKKKQIFMRLRRDLHAAFQRMLSRKGVSESSLAMVLFMIRSLKTSLSWQLLLSAWKCIYVWPRSSCFIEANVKFLACRCIVHTLRACKGKP